MEFHNNQLRNVFQSNFISNMGALAIARFVESSCSLLRLNLSVILSVAFSKIEINLLNEQDSLITDEGAAQICKLGSNKLKYLSMEVCLPFLLKRSILHAIDQM